MSHRVDNSQAPQSCLVTVVDSTQLHQKPGLPVEQTSRLSAWEPDSLDSLISSKSGNETEHMAIACADLVAEQRRGQAKVIQ